MINTLCDFSMGCTTPATRWGMVAVAYGSTARVATCEHHADRWSSLWGSWPMESVDVDAAHAEALEALEDAGFREVAPVGVSLVKPFPTGARVVWTPTFGRAREGVVVGQRFEGQWWVKLDGRERPVSGGVCQLTLMTLV